VPVPMCDNMLGVQCVWCVWWWCVRVCVCCGGGAALGQRCSWSQSNPTAPACVTSLGAHPRLLPTSRSLLRPACSVYDAQKQEAVVDSTKAFGHSVTTITTDELGRCWVGGGESRSGRGAPRPSTYLAGQCSARALRPRKRAGALPPAGCVPAHALRATAPPPLPLPASLPLGNLPPPAFPQPQTAAASRVSGWMCSSGAA
jgi:hypothetical protein